MECLKALQQVELETGRLVDYYNYYDCDVLLLCYTFVMGFKWKNNTYDECTEAGQLNKLWVWGVGGGGGGGG